MSAFVARWNVFGAVTKDSGQRMTTARMLTGTTNEKMASDLTPPTVAMACWNSCSSCQRVREGDWGGVRLRVQRRRV